MDAIEIIKADHRKVEELFAEYESLADDAYAQKRALVDQITRELELHTEMEETITYPAFKDIFESEGDKMVEEGYAEHEVAKHLMEELKSLSPEDEQFDAKVKVLQENIDHHVKEEEEELLPKAQKEMPEAELAAMGEEMEEFKEQNGADED